MLNENQKESSLNSTSSSPSSSCTTRIDKLSNPELHPIKELKHESQANSDEVEGQDSSQEKESSNFIGVTFEAKRDEEEEHTGSDENKRQRKRKEIPQKILLLHQRKRQESNDVIRHEDEEKPFLHQKEATRHDDSREDYDDDEKNQPSLDSGRRHRKEMLHKNDYPDSPGASNRSIKSSIDIEVNGAVNGDHHQVKRHACNSRDRFLSSSTPSRTISIESNLKDTNTPDENREENSRGTNNNLKHQKSLDSNHKFRGPKNRVSSSIATTGAPDGGWGWVVVFASFMISLVADGISFSFGIIFLELSTYFNESKSKTAFVGSLFMSIPLLVGPLASALTEKYGCRTITIVSGLVSCTGFIIGTFATSIEHLFIAFSVAGAGLALSYVTSIVIVAYYFEKKRSLATGLAVCGTGFGTFIFAPLTIYLMEKYGWRGTLLIMSGFFLNIVVFGALMRDLPDDDEEDDDEEEESDAVESDTDSSQSNDHRSLNKHLSNNKSSMRQNNALSLEAGSFLFPTNEVNKSSNMFTSFFQRQASHQPSCSTPFASSFKDSSNNNPLHDVLKSLEGQKKSTATATSPGNNNNTLRTSSSLIHIPTFLTSHRGSFSLDDQQVCIINELSVKKGGVLSRLIQRYPNMLSTFFSPPTHQGIPTSSNHFHPSHPSNHFHPRRTDSSRVNRPAPSLLPTSETDMTPNHEASPSSLYSSPNTYGNNNNSSSIGNGIANNNNNVTCIRVETSSTPAPKGVSIRSPLSSNHTLSFKSPTKLNEPRTVIGKRLSVNPMIVTGYRLNSLIPFEHGSQARKRQRGSITYRSAMLNIHRRHRLRSSSCPDMTVAVVGSFTPSASVQKRKQTWREELKEFFNDIIDVSIFKSIKYSLFCFSNLLLYACIDVPYVYIPDHAITSGSSTKEEASFLISLIGMVNTAGIVLVGYIGDKPWLEPTHLYSGLICCSGISVGLIPLLSSYTSLAILSSLYGLTISANYALVSVILVDLISLDKFTIGYGLLLMVQGIASLIGPPFAGYLCDLTGTYDITFYVTGVCIFISGAVVLPVANSPLCSKLLCPGDSLTKNMIPVPTVDIGEEEEIETVCNAKVHVQMDEDFQEIVL